MEDAARMKDEETSDTVHSCRENCQSPGLSLLLPKAPSAVWLRV